MTHTTTVHDLTVATVDLPASAAREPNDHDFSIEDARVGDRVVVYSRGGWRNALIAKLGRKRVTVAYTTAGAWESAQKIFENAQADRTEQVRASTAKIARSNHAFYVQEANPETAKYTSNRQPGEAERFAEIAATPVEQYVAEQVAREVERYQADRAEVLAGGVEALVHVTCKSVPEADVFTPGA